MISQFDSVYRYPLAGTHLVTQTFDEHIAAAVNYEPGHYNGGIDYGCPTGTPVLATLPGMVVACSVDYNGYGAYVKLDHGHINDVHVESLYAHLSEAIVNTGAHVDAGVRIGISGNSGMSTGPHLHFEVRHDGIPVDPAPILDGNLPLEIHDEISRAVLKQSMNLRNDTLVDDDTVIGRLDAGADIEVMDVIKSGRDTWLMIVAYVAADYDGVRYVEVIDADD